MKYTRILHETEFLCLAHEYEHVFLFNKDLNEVLWSYELFDEPTCGLIGDKGNWVIVGGATLLVWASQEFQELPDRSMGWVSDLRQVSDREIEILIDQWQKNSAIWRLNLETFKKTKVRDFSEYHGRPYQKHIKW